VASRNRNMRIKGQTELGVRSKLRYFFSNR
jgi:hypothetical protein